MILLQQTNWLNWGIPINIYGQNEFQYLLNKESYVGILDNLLSLDGERFIFAGKVQALRKCEGELGAKKKEAEGREKEIALLNFQVRKSTGPD